MNLRGGENVKQNSVFVRFLQAVEKTNDVTLRWWFQKDMIKNNLLSRRDYDNLVHDTAQEVLSSINATVDASEIFDAIDDVNKRLNQLGK